MHYRSLDVRDTAALAGALDEIRRDRGRLDGVVHAAGVREDKLIRDKTAESFARVFDTKVGSARVIADAVGDRGFALFFASVSGWFGNAGQVDYAAANSVLDGIARRARAASPGAPGGGDRLGAVGRDRHGVARAGPRVRAPGHRPDRPRRGGGGCPRRAAGRGAAPAGRRHVRPARRRSGPEMGPEPVAVVGMAGIFPGAGDLATFWDNLVGGVDAITDVPPDRVDPVFFQPRPTGPDRFYCRRGGFIDAAVPFDAVRLRHHAGGGGGHRARPAARAVDRGRAPWPTPATWSGVPDPRPGRRRHRPGRLPDPGHRPARAAGPHRPPAGRLPARAGARPRRRPARRRARAVPDTRSARRTPRPRSASCPTSWPRCVANRLDLQRPGLHARRGLRLLAAGGRRRPSTSCGRAAPT